jgi:exopolyphosphatase / guanosine-5'-triphosphate,3'-diphosphate pyrophosphatase
MANTENIAIIDLGTNTFNLLIAEVGERDEFTIRGKFKEPVKLGEGGINAGHITEAAFERGMSALGKFRKLIDSAKVSQVFAIATSAIRSADNGEQFIARAREEASVEVRPINGNMEASYIHEGVKNGVHLPVGEHVLLIDIGGGSTEFSISLDRQALLLRSLRIGAARLLEKVSPHDPIKAGERKELRQLIQKTAGDLVEELHEFDLHLLVGSSGTFETIASIIAYENGDSLSAEALNGYRFSADAVHKLGKRLRKATRKERLNMDGMDPLRVDMILMGVEILEYLLDHLPIETLMVSGNALKEGILFRYLKDKRNRLAEFMGRSEQNLRAKAVQNLAEKYDYVQAHTLQVSELATRLFEQLSPIHTFGPHEKELLQYAAVLHDIGHFINPSSHHKHGQYLIMNSNLYGFSTNELVVLANLVRYHRKSLPKSDHYHFNILPDREQHIVSYLAGMLRIADSLDKGHRNLVNNLQVNLQPEEILLQVHAPEDVSMEIENAWVQRELLEKTTGKKVKVEQV